jgi:WD40 repeat protein
MAVAGNHRQAVTAVAFSPQIKERDTFWLATASRDSLVRLWSLAISP